MSDSMFLTNDVFYTVEIHCDAKGYHECPFQVEIGEQPRSSAIKEGRLRFRTIADN